MARCFSRSQKLLLLRKAGYKCTICGVPLNINNFAADHIVPYSKGGKTEAWNGQALCVTCNTKKGAKLPE